MPNSPGELLRFPTWQQPNALQSVESWIDSSLSSSNHFLNALLSPVRSFVHDVLHPVFWAGDVIIGAGYSVTKWAFSELQALAYEAIWALNWGFDTVKGLASAYYTDSLNFAAGLVDGAKKFAQGAINVAVAGVRAVVDNVSTYLTNLIGNLRQWAGDAVRYVETELTNAIGATGRWVTALIDDVRTAAAAALSATVHFLSTMIDDARKWAGDRLAELGHELGDVATYVERHVEDALASFYDDVVKPIAGEVRHLIDVELEPIRAVFDVISDAAGWISWITSHVVDDARDLWQLGREWSQVGYDEIVDLALAAANGANR